MKKRLTAVLMAALMGTLCVTGCGNDSEPAAASQEEVTEQPEEEAEAPETPEAEDETVSDQEAADEVAALIDAIYVQQRTENTDKQCAEAKAAWDALTDAQIHVF